MTPTALYRHFDEGGRLLYVGISLSAIARLAQHSSGSDWSRDIRSVEVEWFQTRNEAEAAETEAIASEGPAYNKTQTCRCRHLGTPIGQYLKKKNITQKEFAKQVEVSSAFLSQILSGERRPSLDLAITIDEATNGVVSVKSWPRRRRGDAAQ